MTSSDQEGSNPFSYMHFMSGSAPDMAERLRFPDIRDANGPSSKLPGSDTNPFSYSAFLANGDGRSSSARSSSSADSPEQTTFGGLYDFHREHSLEDMLHTAEILSRIHGDPVVSAAHNSADWFDDQSTPVNVNTSNADWLHPSVDFLSAPGDGRHMETAAESGDAHIHKRMADLQAAYNERGTKIQYLKKELRAFRDAHRSSLGADPAATHAVLRHANESDRALQSEAAAATLRQQVVVERSRVQILESEKEQLQAQVDALRVDETGVPREVREKCTTVAEQLAVAAVSAEVNVKELLAGVRSLKLLSTVLEDVAKVTEIPPTPRNDPPTNATTLSSAHHTDSPASSSTAAAASSGTSTTIPTTASAATASCIPDVENAQTLRSDFAFTSPKPEDSSRGRRGRPQSDNAADTATPRDEQVDENVISAASLTRSSDRLSEEKEPSSEPTMPLTDAKKVHAPPTVSSGAAGSGTTTSSNHSRSHATAAAASQKGSRPSGIKAKKVASAAPGSSPYQSKFSKTPNGK